MSERPEPCAKSDLVVLVVDDHHDTRDGYAMFLRTHGLKPVTAASGKEARRHLETRGPTSSSSTSLSPT